MLNDKIMGSVVVGSSMCPAACTMSFSLPDRGDRYHSYKYALPKFNPFLPEKVPVITVCVACPNLNVHHICMGRGRGTIFF